MSLYGDLSREELEARLEAAEDVCLLASWTASRQDSDRDKAAYEVWRTWWALPGVQAFELKARAERWPDERIEKLARQRDRTRAETLRRLSEQAT